MSLWADILCCCLIPISSLASTPVESPVSEPASMSDDKSPEVVKKHDLIFTRTFNAPIDKLWQAWSESAEVMKWWGPTGFTCPSAKIDFRVGGNSIVCMRAPKEFGGQDMFSSWAYQAIEKHRRIEYVHNLCDSTGRAVDPKSLGLPADFPQNQKHVVTFKDLGNGKSELTITEYGWTPGHMMEMSKLGMNQCLDKMAASFEK